MHRLRQQRHLISPGNTTSQHVVFITETDAPDESLLEKERESSISDFKVEKSLEREIKRCQQRLQSLEKVEATLVSKQHLLSKSRKVKVGTNSFGNSVFKWKAERLK